MKNKKSPALIVLMIVFFPITITYFLIKYFIDLYRIPMPTPSQVKTPSVSQLPRSSNSPLPTVRKCDTSFEEIPIVYKKDVTALREHHNYIVYDLETTGFNPPNSEIIEISMLKITNGVESDRFTSLVKPRKHIPASATAVNGISDADVADAPCIDELSDQIVAFIGTGYPLVGHNIKEFDNKFLFYALGERGLTIEFIDTLSLARKLHPELSNHKLATFISHYKLMDKQTHRAMDDVICNQIIFEKFCDEIMSKTRRTSAQVQADFEEYKRKQEEAEKSGVPLLVDAYLEYDESKCYKIVYTALYTRAVPDIDLHARRRVESYLSIYRGDNEFMHLKCGERSSWFALDTRYLDEEEELPSLEQDANYIKKGRFAGIKIEKSKDMEQYEDIICSVYFRAISETDPGEEITE